MVDDLVEQERGALLEVALADLLALLAAREERVDGLELRVGHRDDVVGADEEVELDDGQSIAVAVEARELQDDEDVVVVAVDLGALVAGVDVLVVERVEARSAPRATPASPGAAWGCGSSAGRCCVIVAGSANGSSGDGARWARVGPGARAAAAGGWRARQVAPGPWREEAAAIW